ncbi:PIN domain-like protein, partial [Roridomyces roridus]
LEKVFYQLCNLLHAPIVFVFVFDGPGRPSMKRGTRVVFHDNNREFMRDLKAMILAFGFYHYEASAPGEAEAELAQLNASGKIDAVITEDSDCFVFGARRVIRTHGLESLTDVAVSRPSVQNSALVYTLDTLPLDTDAFLLCALLLGGDYGPGIPGAGPKVATALAACGFGRELVKILKTCIGIVLDQRLDQWRRMLQKELAENTSGFLDCCHPSLAASMNPTFPDIRVAEMYLYPLTSKSPIFLGAAPDVSSWRPKLPDITSLSSFCSTKFGWQGQPLLKKFNSTLWPGAAFKLISLVRFRMSL